MGRPKGKTMTEEQKVLMKIKRASRKESANSESMKAIADAFKNLYKTIEVHAGSASEEILGTIKKQVSGLSDLTEEKVREARRKAIEVAEENVNKAQEKLEELRRKYNM
jgi:predicted metal-dependent hydrolase